MRILITGARGFVGSYLMGHLGRQHEVDGIDQRPGTTFQGPYQILPSTTLQRYEAIIHLAAHSSVKEANADPRGGVRNNLFGPVELAEKLDGAPFIYASSSSVHAVDARTVYDATKRAADFMVPVVYPNAYALRFGTVCGVSPVMRDDTMLNSMTRSAVKDGVIRARNQHKWRPVLTLGDLAWFVDSVLEDAIPPGLHDVATFLCRIGGYAAMVSEVTGAPIVSEPDTATYDFKMPVLGRTESIYPVIEELVAHWKQH